MAAYRVVQAIVAVTPTDWAKFKKACSITGDRSQVLDDGNRKAAVEVNVQLASVDPVELERVGEVIGTL